MSLEVDVIVTARHVFTVPNFNARPGFCRGGARQWIEAHGLDWREFVRDGIPASTLEATGDAIAFRVVEWARECESKERA